MSSFSSYEIYGWSEVFVLWFNSFMLPTYTSVRLVNTEAVMTPADTHRWGWCWARCVVRPRRCSSGSGCWGAAGPRGPACPGAPGCCRETGSCRCCCSSARRGSETDSRPDRPLWTEAEQHRCKRKAGNTNTEKNQWRREGVCFLTSQRLEIYWVGFISSPVTQNTSWTARGKKINQAHIHDVLGLIWDSGKQIHETAWRRKRLQYGALLIWIWVLGWNRNNCPNNSDWICVKTDKPK